MLQFVTITEAAFWQAYNSVYTHSVAKDMQVLEYKCDYIGVT